MFQDVYNVFSTYLFKAESHFEERVYRFIFNLYMYFNYLKLKLMLRKSLI